MYVIIIINMFINELSYIFILKPPKFSQIRIVYVAKIFKINFSSFGNHVVIKIIYY